MRITIENVPLMHEISIDLKEFCFIFHVCPGLAEFVKKTVSVANSLSEIYESKHHVRSFVKPGKKTWGHGRLIREREDAIFDKWERWEIAIPFKARQLRLMEISANLSILSTLFCIYDGEVDGTGLNQFLTIDSVGVAMINQMLGGAFSFSLSKEVLDYTANIWGDAEWSKSERYQVLMDCMMRVYARLSGATRIKQYLCSSFYGQYRDMPRCAHFLCPGDCACIAPSEYSVFDEFGVSFSPHNTDTKIQQLTLLAVAIKLANMARANI